MEEQKYGILISPAIKLHRQYFKEMCKLIGIKVLYRAPKQGKHWTTFTELETNYESPILTDCIFEEHPNQKTMKKLGWDSELQTEEGIISVPYDLKDIQIGALFIVPSAIDEAKGRLFRVIELSTIMIYPASITCKIIPEWENDYTPTQSEFKHKSFTLLNSEENPNI